MLLILDMLEPVEVERVDTVEPVEVEAVVDQWGVPAHFFLYVVFWTRP